MDLNQRESMYLLIRICNEHENALHRQAEVYYFKRDAAFRKKDQAAANKWGKFGDFYSGLADEVMKTACKIQEDFKLSPSADLRICEGARKTVHYVGPTKHHDDGPKLDLLAEFWKS